MTLSTPEQRRQHESFSSDELDAHQLQRFNELLAAMLPHNQFYAQKLGRARQLESLDELETLPFTFKEELLGARRNHASLAAPGELAGNLTWPLERYVRYHQTSGTRGRPLVVLDTADDWKWWIDCWQYILDAARIESSDRLMMAFSFGPFIGFWSAFDAAAERGCLVVPGGGMNSLSRLELLRNSRATVLFCTPSYALHLAEIAAEHKIQLASLPVRQLVLAGEPGGSVVATRCRIAEVWNAQVLDHCGATEVGPWGYGDAEGRGLYVMESHFIAEFLSLESGRPAADRELSELVITNLGRVGSPVIRYRTGDLVRPTWRHDGPNRFVFLEGGVLGRTDDMMIIRGVNVFPSAIEQILRSFPEVSEFRLTAHKVKAMDQLTVEIEDRLGQPQRVAEELRVRLGLKVDVRSVPLGSLPRFEGKGKRFVDQRHSQPAGAP
jgi:phenylacetate-CoA ligase